MWLVPVAPTRSYPAIVKEPPMFLLTPVIPLPSRMPDIPQICLQRAFLGRAAGTDHLRAASAGSGAATPPGLTPRPPMAGRGGAGRARPVGRGRQRAAGAPAQTVLPLPWARPAEGETGEGAGTTRGLTWANERRPGGARRRLPGGARGWACPRVTRRAGPANRRTVAGGRASRPGAGGR